MNCYFWRWGFWMRFKSSNRGIFVAMDSPVLFSERNGYCKGYRIGRFSVEFLD